MTFLNYGDLVNASNPLIKKAFYNNINTDIPANIPIEWQFQIVDLPDSGYYLPSSNLVDPTKLTFVPRNKFFHNILSIGGRYDYREYPSFLKPSAIIPHDEQLPKIDGIDFYGFVCPKQAIVLQIKNPETLPNKKYIVELNTDITANEYFDYGETIVDNVGGSLGIEVVHGVNDGDFFTNSTDTNTIEKLTNVNPTIPSGTTSIKTLVEKVVSDPTTKWTNIKISTEPNIPDKTKIVIVDFDPKATIIISNYKIGTSKSDTTFKDVIKLGYINLIPISDTLSMDTAKELLKVAIEEQLRATLPN